VICNRHRAISILFGYDPALLDYLFTSSRQGLARPASTLVREAALIGQAAPVQVAVALDFWDGGRRSRLADVTRLLDAHRYDCFIAALEYYVAAGAGACRCHRCSQRRPKTQKTVAKRVALLPGTPSFEEDTNVRA